MDNRDQSALDQSQAVDPWRSWWAALVVGAQLLTRVPMPDVGLQPNQVVGRSLLFYPFIGGLIGLLLLAGLMAVQLLYPGLYTLQAALLLGGWCLLTGGLHLDGLADSADAWVGGFGDRERTLRLMKDPTCGPMAVMLVVLLLLVKFAALQELLSRQSLWWLAALVLGRAQVLLLFLTTPYVRDQGLASGLTSALPRRQLWTLLLVLTLAGGLLLGSGWWVLTGSALVLFLPLRWLMVRRIGGTTGDTAGALIEVTEMALLLAALTF